MPASAKDVSPRPALLLALFDLFFLSACASVAPPQRIEEVGFKSRAVAQETEGLTVSAVALGPEESRAVFGLPMHEEEIQPVWLSATNNRDQRVWLLPLFFDALYYTPAEAAFIHHGWFSEEVNGKIDRHFAENAVPLRIEPGQRVEGFLYGTPDLGLKALNLVYIAEGASVHTAFVVRVPGLARETLDLTGALQTRRLPEPDHRSGAARRH